LARGGRDDRRSREAKASLGDELKVTHRISFLGSHDGDAWRARRRSLGKIFSTIVSNFLAMKI
jgi:hypothetical protein